MIDVKPWYLKGFKSTGVAIWYQSHSLRVLGWIILPMLKL